MVSGDAMSMKEQLLFIWLLAVVVAGFVFRHFWASTLFVLARAVALHLVCLPGLAKFAAVIFGAHFLL
jgi:hypothetical protein